MKTKVVVEMVLVEKVVCRKRLAKHSGIVEVLDILVANAADKYV